LSNHNHHGTGKTIGRSHHGAPVASKLKRGIILTGFILVAELIGGLVSNSLALLSDAGHVFTDFIALSLSYYGVRQAQRPASYKMTFGYHRIGVIIAIVNAISIFAIAAFIFYEAFRRFQEPPEVNGSLMLSVAVLGLIANLLVVYWLRSEQKTNLNVKSAFWHALGDTLASIGVIAGGIIIVVTGLYTVDVVISVFIGLVIIAAAWSIFKEGFHVLLEATPKGINPEELVGEMKKVPGVKDVHDIHIWSISPEIHAMSCHILIEDRMISETAHIRNEVEKILKEYNIGHSTIQLECQECEEGDLYCKLAYKTLKEQHKKKK